MYVDLRSVLEWRRLVAIDYILAVVLAVKYRELMVTEMCTECLRNGVALQNAEACVHDLRPIYEIYRIYGKLTQYTSPRHVARNEVYGHVRAVRWFFTLARQITAVPKLHTHTHARIHAHAYIHAHTRTHTHAHTRTHMSHTHTVQIPL